jgi:thiol-disulfide isomerase/thioredoxin
MLIRRRAVLAAGGTLAAAWPLRKSEAQEMSSLEQAFKPTTPPAPLPMLPFTDATGKAMTLADYRGRGVVLNLWATWCMPCVAEMPALAVLAEKLKGADIAVLPLSSDHGGVPVVEKFYTDHRISDLPVLLDHEGDDARTLNVRGIPTTLLIDPQGREVGRTEGAVAWGDDAAVARLKALIGHAAPPMPIKI